MAKIEIVYEEEDHPASIERIEVRAWALAGTDEQMFLMSGGFTFGSAANVWLEYIYTVQGAQIFYARNLMHAFDGPQNPPASEAALEKILQSGEGAFELEGFLPQTGLKLKAEKRKYTDGKGQEQIYQNCELTLAVDAGAVFGYTMPGSRMIQIKLDPVELEDAVRFMRELVCEIAEVEKGKHPDPGRLPPGSSNWAFVAQLNRQAYDTLSEKYRERYFENPLLAQAFEGWLDMLPAGARVLDAGCGHGDPVIDRLLEKGMQVTGSDFSPAMLRRAQEQFPQAAFVNRATPEIDFEAEFDGACSFSSTLYLDPVDLFHSIYRLHRALKPGGLLFLYGYDLHPGWRGSPYDVEIGRWMWSWTYSMEDAARAAAEHGYFEVLGAFNVTTDEELEERRARADARQAENQEKAEQARREAGDSFISLPPLEIPLPGLYGEEEADAEPLDAAESQEGQPAAPDGEGSPDEEAVSNLLKKLPEAFAKIAARMSDPYAGLAYRYVVIARRLERDDGGR
jgi:SAM-dependent methyltransferase